MALGIRAVLERPCVKQRNGGVERTRTNDLARAYLADPRRIAAYRIEIIVRNKVLEGLSSIGWRRADGRRIQAFEPFEGLHRVLG